MGALAKPKPVASEQVELQEREKTPDSILVLKKNIRWYWNSSWKKRYITCDFKGNEIIFYKDKACKKMTEKFTIDEKFVVTPKYENSSGKEVGERGYDRQEIFRLQNLQKKRCCLLPNTRHCRLVKPCDWENLTGSEADECSVPGNYDIEILESLRKLVDPKGS